MPFLRGWVYLPAQERPGTVAFVVMTNDRWNQTMSQVGVLPIRASVEPFDAPHSVKLADGTYLVASRLVAPRVAPDAEPVLGVTRGALAPDVLAAAEDRLCAFLQLPELLAPTPRVARPVGDATRYAVWGEIYRAGPRVEGERKRRIVVSPNPWNAVSGMATFVRTTSAFKADAIEFPRIQRGAARACCGDATTFSLGEVLTNPRDRPAPHTTTMGEMVQVARGLVATHDLGAAVRRPIA